MLKVNSVFLSMQGEGIDTGVPTVFIRLAGCSMKCSFCDEGSDLLTFVELNEVQIVEQVLKVISMFNDLGTVGIIKNIVITGGEPLEQDLLDLVVKLRGNKFRVGIETNGTKELGDLFFLLGVVTISPKVPIDKCKIEKCTNLKILYPYIKNITAESYNGFEAYHKFIQPIWSTVSAYDAFVEVCRLGPPWKLGLQVHKLIGMQ